MKVLLIVLECISLLSIAVFGCIGLLTDFRDKESKRVTRAGMATLFGVVVSLVFGVAIKAFDFSIKQADAVTVAREAKALASDAKIAAIAAKEAAVTGRDVSLRSAQILRTAMRSIEPVDFTNLSIDCGFKFSAADPAFSTYRKRIHRTYQELKEELDRSKLNHLSKLQDGLELMRVGRDKVSGEAVDLLRISPGSSFWPDLRDEADAADVLNALGLVIELDNPQYPDPRDDLMLVFSGRLDGKRVRGTTQLATASLTYEPLNSFFRVHVEGARCYADSPTKAFASIIDFEDSRIRIETAVDTSAAPSMSLSEFRLRFGSNARWLILAEDIEKSNIRTGIRFSTTLVDRLYPIKQDLN